MPIEQQDKQKDLFRNSKKDKGKPKKKLNIQKIVGFYVSVLEHQWVIIMDAKNAHDIEQLCISVGISAISTVKIVPINDFNKIVTKIQSI
jgi:hypothetical protein